MQTTEATHNEDSRVFNKYSNAHHVIEVTELTEALDCIQPYTQVDENGVESTCAGYLANVEADSDQPPQMRKPAVRLQHAYEYLKFEPGKKLSIDMKAYREGRHKESAGSSTSGSSPSRRSSWMLSQEYAEQNNLAPSELPVIVSIRPLTSARATTQTSSETYTSP